MTIQIEGSQTDQGSEMSQDLPQEPQGGGAPQGQDPKSPAASPLPPNPPPDFDDKMARLLQSRVDALSHSLVDDRGRVLREAMSPEDALRNTIAYLPKYLQSDSGADMLREYMAGGKVPGEFAPRKGMVPSVETQQMEWRARAGREASPAYAALRDYVVDPLGSIIPAAVQVGADVVVGGANIASSAVGGPQFDKIDVKGKFHGLGGTTRDELNAIASTASMPAKIQQGAAEMVGTASGFVAGGIGKVLGLGGKAGGAIGKALFGPSGKAIGHAAGVFGAYEGITAEEGKRLEGAAKGAAVGTLMGAAQQVASIALRWMFSANVKALGPNEREAMDALKKWGAENKLAQQRGETAKAFDKRVIDAWISAGLPGAPKMPARTLINASVRGGADAVGFSLIDQQFREDLLDAAWHGDASKWESVITKFSGNFLGTAALHLPLSSIVPWQRRQHTTGEPSAYTEGRIVDPFDLRGVTIPEKPAAVDAEFSVQPKEPLALPAPKETRAEKVTREQNQRMADAYAEQWRQTIEGGDSVEQRYVELAGGTENAIALGWKPAGATPESMRVEIPGTPHSYEVRGEAARPSKELRDTLGLPEEMPAKDLVAVIEKASLASALHAKAALPGQEVAVGMRATPGRGEEPPMVRRVVMGEVQESPLRPDLEWKAVGAAPARPKEPIEPEQRQAVDVLRTISEQSDKLDPVDRTLLNGAIDVLDSVSAAGDQAVAETLAAAPELIPAIEKGEPGAVKALAESLTTKTPERAMADAKRWSKGSFGIDMGQVKKVRRQDNGEDFTYKSREHVSGETFGTFGVHRQKDESKRGEQWSVTHLPTGLAAGRFEKKADARKYAEMMEAEIDRRGIGDAARSDDPDTAGSALIDAAADVRSRMVTKTRSDWGPEQRGSSEIPGLMLDAAETAREAVSEGAAAAGTVGNFLTRFYRSQIDRVEAMGMRDVAELGREAVTAQKRFQARLDAFGLMDLRRQKRADLDSMEDLKGDGNGGYSDRYARAMDEATARHFGEAELTDAERKIVAMGRRVTLEAGRIAEELGVEQTDSKGRNPRKFTVDPNRRVLVREYTPEMQHARLNQSGPLWDAMVGWLEKTYGWTPAEAKQHFTEGRSLTATDATEIRRSIPVIPTHLDVPGRGVVRILESRPLEHAERLAFRNSHVMGSLSVMPRNMPEAADGAKTLPTPQGLEPLPLPAQQLVDKVLNEKGPDAAEAVARMVRAMNGMPVVRSDRMFTPGEPGYRFVRAMSGLFGLKKASALTMSFAANVAEPVSNIAHFGAQAVGKGYSEAVRALVSGRFADLHRQAVADGFVADSKLNDPLHGDTGLETASALMKKAADILTTPMRVTQDLNEMANYVAARERLDAMKAGQGSKADANSLSLLGFKGPEIEAMLDGRGTPQQYERYQRGIVGNLAGGRSLAGAERSDAAHSKRFNSLVWFTNFFQTRTRVMASLARDIAAAKGDEKAAKIGEFIKFAAFTTASGAIGSLFKQYLLGGSDGVADYIRERTAGDASDISKDFLGLLASGVVGGLGQPVADAFRALESGADLQQRAGQSAIRLLGPVDAGIQAANYFRALAGQDVPGYENKGTLGKTAKYLRDVIPAAKAVHEGLFGSSMLAITDKSIALDNAQDSYYRWLRERRPDEFKSRRAGTDEERAWRDSMRSVMDLVMAGKDWSDEDVVNAVVDAQAAKMTALEAKQEQAREQGQKPSKLRTASELYRDARQAVASSLRTRQMLPKPGEMPTEDVDSLMRHLGDKNAQTLRDYDEVLEALAKRISETDLRRRIADR